MPTAHIVPGDLLGRVILNRAQQDVGQYEITAVSGDALAGVPSGDGLLIQSKSGHVGVIRAADAKQSNGIFHVVNEVLVPKGLTSESGPSAPDRLAHGAAAPKGAAGCV